ncbi:MAG: hypothetical protein GF364_17365 [Candidatus Lokiarchaeota archaeon]|nr:hypothetical protein [Candidatus Lokiarchaeota archaeon]
MTINKKEMKKIIITPETHWDREWYLPFQEYRAKLVLLMDTLLDILQKDPDYKNFTLDGQTVPLEDYLEVKPNKESLIKKYIAEGRISVGPMYILPDIYLVSGEAMIRNLMLGHNIGNKYGRVMKAGYIPDPFGHFAQMPQILSGFEIDSILFARGFGDEFEKLNLDMEFLWQAPSKAAEIIGIHLIKGYGSLAHLDDTIDPTTKKYENALKRMYRTIRDIDVYTCTNAIILNNGSDHLFPQPHLPEVIQQWNEKYSDEVGVAEQADFEKYLKLVKENNPELKPYQGELHGGKYNYLLSGVLSTRMWIKLWNKLCETRLERYTEPFATITWLLDEEYEYPKDYIWTAWRWLLKNHPHDSICGCSVDYVHDVDMKARFGWAEQIGLEIFKNSAISLSKLIKFDTLEGERFPVFVYNPCPRERSTLVTLKLVSDENMLKIIPPEMFTITDADGNEIFNVAVGEDIEERFLRFGETAFSLNFIAENLPPLGIRTYYLVPGEEQTIKEEELENKVIEGEEKVRNFIENKYYKIFINKNGSFDVFDKEEKVWFKEQGIIEDVGDWGDEYDFSGPRKDQTDKYIASVDFVQQMDVMNYGIGSSFRIYYELALPLALKENRKSRTKETIINPVEVYVSLNAVEKIVYVDVSIYNNSNDHRLRMLFPSGMTAKGNKVDADGHFMVVSRDIDLPPKNGTADWSQPPVPTHHQNNFVSITDGTHSFSVFNNGLPEYEAIKQPDGTVILAVTLLRSVGWLSRGDFKSRSNNAGPPIPTPGAQCHGLNTCTLGVHSGKGNWLESKTHLKADEFACMPEIINPISLNQQMRMHDTYSLREINMGNNIQPGNNIDSEFSICELQGDAFLLTSFKRADRNNEEFIVRLVNMTDKKQKGQIKLLKNIESAEIVNLYEEKPSENNPVKAEIEHIEGQIIEFLADPHVILSIAIKF